MLKSACVLASFSLGLEFSLAAIPMEKIIPSVGILPPFLSLRFPKFDISMLTLVLHLLQHFYKKINKTDFSIQKLIFTVFLLR